MPSTLLRNPADDRAEAIFKAALEVSDPDQRAALISAQCEDDVAVEARVRRLLVRHDVADGCGEAEAPLSPGVEAELARLKPEEGGEQIGNYKLREQIGEGGFGTVWVADQETPVKRRVALKIIKLGMDTKEVIARFEQERQALAMMDHPNIARVLDAGATQFGRAFFVMELVRGVPITDYCEQANLATAERLDLFTQVCHAVQHAHQKGIIHRDLKPSNILVTLTNGVPVPKVIDFGIAKATEGRLTDATVYTQLSQFIGTPAYMSPEQAEMSALDIDTRSDIYSLGVLLYELLTGSTPFDAEELTASGIDAMRKTIREKEPLRPSVRLSQQLAAAAVKKLNPPLSDAPRGEDDGEVSPRQRSRAKETIALLQGDLDWIVMKCLEKDRTRRYETANGLAADLKRHLHNEPVVARPPSTAYRLQKAWRRNKLAFGAAAAVACALVLGAGVSAWQAARAINAERAERALSRQARIDRDRAVHAEEESRTQAAIANGAWATARQRAYAAEVNVAFQALAENNLARAIDLLNRQRPKPGEDDLRSFEWRYLWQLCRPDDTATFHGDGALGMAFSPDGKWLAYADHQIVVRDVRSQAVVATIASSAKTLAFAPAGKLLVSGESSSVKLWSTESWEEVRSLPGARFPAVFAPDGEWLVTGADGGYRVWNVKTWEAAGFCPGVPQLVWHLRHAVAFSPDGKLLLTPGHRDGIDAGQFQVWDFPSLAPRTNFARFDGMLGSAAFAPDGTHLLTGSWTGALFVWDIALGRVVETLNEHTGWITATTVARDAQTFATASCDRTLIVWDAATFRPLVRLRGHLGEIWSAALSPDGRTLASGSPEGTTKLWDTATRHGARELAGFAWAIGFSAESRVLAVGSREGVSLWDIADGTTKKIPVTNVSAGGSDQSLPIPGDVYGREPLGVLGRVDGTLELWNLADPARVASWSAHEGEVNNAVFSPNARVIASSGKNGAVKLWDVATHREVRRLDDAVGKELWCLAFSPDGRLLAGSGNSSRVRVWDTESGNLVLELGGHRGGVESVAFSPDGQMLASCDLVGNAARLWDIPSGKLRATLKGHIQGVRNVAFTPDGRTLATGSDDRKVKLWNIATEQEVATLPLPGQFDSFRFSPDGRTLAVGYEHGRQLHLRLWQAPSFEEIAAVDAGGKTEIKKP